VCEMMGNSPSVLVHKTIHSGQDRGGYTDGARHGEVSSGWLVAVGELNEVVAC
jgi:hypothetical protein